MKEVFLPVVIRDVEDELERAVGLFGSFHNTHEAWGVIREEYLELEDEIRKSKPSNPNIEAIRHEAMHLAAMATRLMVDSYKWE